jgi:hypothetical protein
MRHPGQTIPRSQIAEGVSERELDSLVNLLDVHVAHLRKKIDGAGAAHSAGLSHRSTRRVTRWRIAITMGCLVRAVGAPSLARGRRCPSSGSPRPMISGWPCSRTRHCGPRGSSWSRSRPTRSRPSCGHRRRTPAVAPPSSIRFGIRRPQTGPLRKLLMMTGARLTACGLALVLLGPGHVRTMAQQPIEDAAARVSPDGRDHDISPRSWSSQAVDRGAAMRVGSRP